MSLPVDYLVASLKPLAFDAPPPYTAEEFAACVGEVALPPAWRDLETQIRNTLAEERARRLAARGASADTTRWRRPAHGCALYWQQRVRAALAEKDPRLRDTAVDRVFWDAAGELTPPADPLGRGALATYAIRLTIARRRAAVSSDAGLQILDRLTDTGKKES